MMGGETAGSRRKEDGASGSGESGPGQDGPRGVAGTGARSAEVDALTSGFPVVVDLPVAWGEMDAMGHVNGVVFVRYFETSRFTYFAKLGLSLEGMGSAERGWILGSVTCRYRASLTFPDTVSVGTRVKALGADRYVMEHRVVSHRLEQIAAEGEAVVVAYDYSNGRKSVLTRADREAIATLEGREPGAMADAKLDRRGA